MNDPVLDFVRTSMVFFPLVMIGFPLVFVLFVPTKAEGPNEIATARTRQLALGVMTLLATAVWGALTLIAQTTQNTIFDQFARFSWTLFFPLWFGLAMPAIRAKNQAWGDGLCGGTSTENPIRTASLTNRARENPVGKWHWVLMAVVSIGMFVLIASRGLFAFGPDGPAVAAARFRWAIATGTFGFCTLVMLMIMPFSIARMQTEPEPLDPAGSEELVVMYRAERRKRVLGLFWMLAVVQPLVLGAIMAGMVWLTGVSGRTMGLIGAVAGTSIGLAGAVFGIVSAIRRVRIAEAKARLEAAGGEPRTSPPTAGF